MKDAPVPSARDAVELENEGRPEGIDILGELRRVKRSACGPMMLNPKGVLLPERPAQMSFRLGKAPGLVRTRRNARARPGSKPGGTGAVSLIVLVGLRRQEIPELPLALPAVQGNLRKGPKRGVAVIGHVAKNGCLPHRRPTLMLEAEQDDLLSLRVCRWGDGKIDGPSWSAGDHPGFVGKEDADTVAPRSQLADTDAEGRLGLRGREGIGTYGGASRVGIGLH